MKKGKFINVNTHNNVKIGYGTVDYKNLKTINKLEKFYHLC